MEKKSRRSAFNALVSIGLVFLVVFVFNGCRSADGAKESVANASVPSEASLAATADTATQESAELPRYAQGTGENVGSTDPSIRLASANARGNDVVQTAGSPQEIVTLRTLNGGDDFHHLVQQAPGTVLVDFYADWCGPCRKQGQVLHDLESFAASHQAQIIKVDVDQHKAIAKEFAVASLPTLLVIRDGKVVERKVGLTNQSRLQAMMQ